MAMRRLVRATHTTLHHHHHGRCTAAAAIMIATPIRTMLPTSLSSLSSVMHHHHQQQQRYRSSSAVTAAHAAAGTVPPATPAADATTTTASSPITDTTTVTTLTPSTTTKPKSDKVGKIVSAEKQKAVTLLLTRAQNELKSPHGSLRVAMEYIDDVLVRLGQWKHGTTSDMTEQLAMTARQRAIALQIKAGILLEYNTPQQLHKVIQCLDESLQLLPGQRDTHRYRSIAALRREDAARALEHCEIERKLAAADPTTELNPAPQVDLLSRYAAALQLNGRVSDSMAATKEGLALDPAHPWLLQQELKLLGRRDTHYLERLTNYTTLAMERNHEPSLRYLGAEYAELGRHSEALQCWTTLLGKYPQEPRLRGLRGVALTGLFQWDAAMEELDAAWLGSESPPLEIVLCTLRILSFQGRTKEAAAVVREAKNLLMLSAHAQAQLAYGPWPAQKMAGLKEKEEKEKAAAAAADHSNKDKEKDDGVQRVLQPMTQLEQINLLYAIADYYRRAAVGDYDRAIQYVDRVLAIDSHHYQSLVLKGRILYSLKKSQTALKVLGDASTAHPNEADAWYYRAVIMRDEMKDANALAELDAQLMKGNKLERLYWRAKFLARIEGQWHEAKATMGELMALMGEHDFFTRRLSKLIDDHIAANPTIATAVPAATSASVSH